MQKLLERVKPCHKRKAMMTHPDPNGRASARKGDLSLLSDGNSSPEADDERYKDLEELYGKENPVFKGIKIVLEHKRRRRKLIKKDILLGMYHDTCANNHIGCMWRQEFSGS